MKTGLELGRGAGTWKPGSERQQSVLQLIHGGLGGYLCWERVYDARFSHSRNQSKLSELKIVILVKVEWQQINSLPN